MNKKMIANELMKIAEILGTFDFFKIEGNVLRVSAISTIDFKGELAPSSNFFSAWYVPDKNIIINFDYGSHDTFIREFFSSIPKKIEWNKQLDDIVSETRTKLKNMMGKKIGYDVFYKLGWVRLNKDGRDYAVSNHNSAAKFEDFMTVVDYALKNAGDKKIYMGFDFRGKYGALEDVIASSITRKEVLEALRRGF